MQRKITWMRYLLIGSSIVLGLSTLISCFEVLDADIGPISIKITYINNTEDSIRYSRLGYFTNYENQEKILVFRVGPQSSHTINIEGEHDTSIDFDPLTCCLGVFEGFQGRGSVLIELENDKCVVFKSGEGPTIQNIEGYEVSSPTNTSIEYVYTFNESDFVNAENCEALISN